MKEVIIHPGTRAELIDSPIPTPQAHQLLIKVAVTGINQKDWKFPDWTSASINQGDDIAGTIHTMGPDVKDFKPGDRVAALHQLGAPGGSYAEYAVAWDYTTFHIPSFLSFEGNAPSLPACSCPKTKTRPLPHSTLTPFSTEASTLPLPSTTAALALYHNLHLPLPTSPASTPLPLIIHNASSAVGSFAIKLATASKIHPIIAICGAGAPYVNTLLSPSLGDRIIDYRNGSSAIIQGIKDGVQNAGCEAVNHAFDATTADGSWRQLADAMDGKRAITFVLFEWQGKEMPAGMDLTQTQVGMIHGDEKAAAMRDFASMYFGLLSKGLEDGWMAPHPHRVFDGGLESGIQEALLELKAGKASAVKFVMPV
ncbi:MAG: hypothetical protein Q9180_006800 [Flavoplaca navasiana]